MTLDELLADLDREVVRTWSGEGLAATAALAGGGDAGRRYLLLAQGGHRVAVPAAAVVAVSEMPHVAAVPFSPPWLRGLARSATGVVAVVDLERLLASSGAAKPSCEPPLSAAGEQAAPEILLVVRTADAALDGGLAVRGIARLVTLSGLPEGLPAAPGALVAGLVADPSAPGLPPAAALDIDILLSSVHRELGA